MNEKIQKYTESMKAFWSKRSKGQKGIFIGSFVLVIAIIITISFLTWNEKFVPLYSNLSLQEMSQVQAELDARGVPYEIGNGGATISVPEERAETLLVELAGQNIPSTGNIDFSFFSENASWGITDNEFSIMKLDAMRTELAKLIKSVDGISDANVMITLPQESVFLNDANETATASIVIHTELGHQFQENQIESLYHLVSKAIPNLPKENIIIRNQYLEYFDQASSMASSDQGIYTYQQGVKQDIEKDIQRRLQQMIGTMVGMEKVIVSVTADIDFTNENRVEELVTPVDLENMEGLPVSIETISETYSGNQDIGGVPGAGDEDITGYQGVDGNSDGDYELLKETINNEFNRIRKEIVESPYKVRDLGVQVAIDNVSSIEGETVQYLTQQEQNSVETGISSIINSIITTSIDKDYGDIDPTEKVSIVFQEFSGVNTIGQEGMTTGTSIFSSGSTWLYIVGAILLIGIIIVGIVLMKNRRKQEEEVFESISRNVATASPEIPDLQTEGNTETDIRKHQLEKLAKDKPEEFAKLLRSWMAED